MRHHKHFLALCSAAALSIGVLGGCTSSTPELTESQKQDAILQDPMNYKPNVGGSISGGDTGNFDSNGFNSDMKHVLDP